MDLPSTQMLNMHFYKVALYSNDKFTLPNGLPSTQMLNWHSQKVVLHSDDRFTLPNGFAFNSNAKYAFQQGCLTL